MRRAGRTRSRRHHLIVAHGLSCEFTNSVNTPCTSNSLQTGARPRSNRQPVRGLKHTHAARQALRTSPQKTHRRWRAEAIASCCATAVALARSARDSAGPRGGSGPGAGRTAAAFSCAASARRRCSRSAPSSRGVRPRDSERPAAPRSERTDDRLRERPAVCSSGPSGTVSCGRHSAAAAPPRSDRSQGPASEDSSAKPRKAPLLREDRRVLNSNSSGTVADREWCLWWTSGHLMASL
mmetsp:Transcript_30323/g.79462  ORF Transcript_30323/g.79462 Transcript_30323/m.79462 type:complete len:238 (+) Transcript_30323:3-716(+)